MPIFRAIGFGIFIVTLSLLLPDVLTAGRGTAIAFLDGARMSAQIAANLVAASASSIPPPSSHPSSLLSPPQLPQAPTIPFPLSP